MNKIFSPLYSIIFFIMLSCSGSDQPTLQEDTSQSEKEIEQTDTLQGNPNITKTIISPNDTLVPFLFEGEDLCGQSSPNGPLRFLSPDTLDKYGRGNIYHIQRQIENDTIYYSFTEIGDCCYKTAVSFRLVDDSLFLFPGYQGDGPCDCLCDYRFEYCFPEKDYRHFWIGVKN